MVVVGWLDAATHFDGCTRAASLHNDAGAPGEEPGVPVLLCRSVRGSWAERWPDLVHYDA